MIDLDTVASVWQSYVNFAVDGRKNSKVAMTLTLMVWHSRHNLDAILQNALLNEAFPIDSGASCLGLGASLAVCIDIRSKGSDQFFTTNFSDYLPLGLQRSASR